MSASLTFEGLGCPTFAAKNARKHPLGYSEPLPVQATVIPFLSRAVSSGIPLDVCLSAPTGSGKTLCYLMPMLRAVSAGREMYGDVQVRGIVLVPTRALGTQVLKVLRSLTAHTPLRAVSVCGEDAASEGRLLFRSALTADGCARYFPNADIVVATPQRLMKHVGGQWGAAAGASDPAEVDGAVDEVEDADCAHVFENVDYRAAATTAVRPTIPLHFLRLLVIDEADEVLAGSFTNIAAQLVRQYELELSYSQCATFSGSRNVEPLHKVLCSATLSAHIVKVADVRLRNARHFTLNSNGETQAEQSAETQRTDWRISTKFALPRALQEHLLVVQDQWRHASILHLVRHILKQRDGEARTPDAAEAEAPTGGGLIETPALPACGRTILVFCAQPSAARTLGHFFIAAGISVMEFTSLTNAVERQKAILHAIAGSVDVVVTTDALMRGIDLPGVGYVVMYDPPRNLQQYVHRIGRTARANSGGHAYILASRVGPSGGLEDGQVASFKGFDAMLTRMRPVVQERDIQRVPEDVIAEADGFMRAAAQVSGHAAAATKADKMQRSSPRGAAAVARQDEVPGKSARSDGSIDLLAV